MLNIFLCEDSNPQRLNLEKLIENYIMIDELDMKLCYSTYDPNKLIEYIAGHTGTGLYFLDINLNSTLNGLSLAQKIRTYDPRGFICFITSHSEMCYMTFTYKVEAMDFILKDNPAEMKTRIHQCMLNALKLHSSIKNTEQPTLCVKSGDKYLTVPLDEILFLETSQSFHKVLLHTQHRLIEFRGNLKDLVNDLDARFFRCHRSFIVNQEQIKEINKAEGLIHMKNGETCLLSLRSSKSLFKSFSMIHSKEES